MRVIDVQVKVQVQEAYIKVRHTLSTESYARGISYEYV